MCFRYVSFLQYKIFFKQFLITCYFIFNFLKIWKKLWIILNRKKQGALANIKKLVLEIRPMTHYFWICKNNKIQVQSTFEKCKITNLLSRIINIFMHNSVCCWYTWCIFYILVMFVDTFDELNNTWYTSLVWYTWYVVDTFVKLCKYTRSIKYIDALSIICLLNCWYIYYDLFIHLLCFVHTLNELNTLYKFDTLNKLMINILYSMIHSTNLIHLIQIICLIPCMCWYIFYVYWYTQLIKIHLIRLRLCWYI